MFSCAYYSTTVFQHLHHNIVVYVSRVIVASANIMFFFFLLDTHTKFSLIKHISIYAISAVLMKFELKHIV